MVKIAFCNTEEKDKVYFNQKLGDDHQITYYQLPQDRDSIDEDTEILTVFVGQAIDQSLIERLPQLKLIACRSTGYNNVDLKAAQAHNIAVVNVPSYGASTVAEYAYLLILMLCRRFNAIQANIDTGNRAAERGMTLSGKTLGIIGTGSIGRGVATIAKGFGMNVLAYDVCPNEEQASSIGFEYVSVEELLRESDIVSLHMPSNDSTYHFINKERLQGMKPDALLINTARGELIDTAALVRALRQQEIGGAGLDVLEHEEFLDSTNLIKLASDTSKDTTIKEDVLLIEALRSMPNVLITNHNAYNTNEAIELINQTTIENITNFLTGKVSNSVL
jgi:D-lactate dehydrogenase